MLPGSWDRLDCQLAGRVRLDVRFDNDTVWLSQDQIASLPDAPKANLSEHIWNVLAERELTADATVREYRTVRRKGLRGVAASGNGAQSALTYTPKSNVSCANDKTIESHPG